VSTATLGGLIGMLVAARHAGGYRYDFPERVLRQFAGHCRREGYADGSIVKEAVEEFLYGRHLNASTIRRGGTRPARPGRTRPPVRLARGRPRR
jgi:integrase/recombinase XerD